MFYHMEKLYSSLRKLLTNFGIFVEAKMHQTAFEIEGRQAINIDDKTSGGIIQFPALTS